MNTQSDIDDLLDRREEQLAIDGADAGMDSMWNGLPDDSDWPCQPSPEAMRARRD